VKVEIHVEVDGVGGMAGLLRDHAGRRNSDAYRRTCRAGYNGRSHGSSGNKRHSLIGSSNAHYDDHPVQA